MVYLLLYKFLIVSSYSVEKCFKKISKNEKSTKFEICVCFFDCESFCFVALHVFLLFCVCLFVFLYKKYGVTCCVGITRSESGTALNIIGLRSLEVLKFRMDATLPHR